MIISIACLLAGIAIGINIGIALCAEMQRRAHRHILPAQPRSQLTLIVQVLVVAALTGMAIGVLWLLPAAPGVDF